MSTRRILTSFALVLLSIGLVSLAVVACQQRSDAPSPPVTGDAPRPQASLPATGKAALPPIPPPRSTRPLQLFDYGRFRVGFDNDRRAGAWGMYSLDGPIIHTTAQPKRPKFQTEKDATVLVTHTDYENPGNVIERGHIVPSYAMWSRYGDEARRATFIMTNVFPQDGDLNGKLWEDLEDDVAGQVYRGQVKDQGYAGRLRNVTVIAGPIYEAHGNALPSAIPIPAACFHIIYDYDEAAQQYRARAYIVPNKSGLDGPSSRYARSIRDIERATGLDFMPDGVPAPEALETTVVEAEW